MAKTHTSTRKRLTVALIGATALGAVVASAASLGGLSSAALGANDTVVASCDTDGVTTSYASAWDATDKRYETTAVTVGGVSDACDGQSLNVTLADGTGAALTSGTLSIPTSASVDHSVSLAAGVASESVSSVHVAIS